MPDISDAPSRLQDQQDGCRGSFDPCLTQPEHSSLFPRTTVADQSVVWLVTTSGEPLLVHGLAQQQGLVPELALQARVLELLAALGGLGSGLPVDQVWAVGAAVEDQPLKLVVAGLPGDLSDQGCLLP